MSTMRLALCCLLQAFLGSARFKSTMQTPDACDSQLDNDRDDIEREDSVADMLESKASPVQSRLQEFKATCTMRVEEVDAGIAAADFSEKPLALKAIRKSKLAKWLEAFEAQQSQNLKEKDIQSTDTVLQKRCLAVWLDEFERKR